MFILTACIESPSTIETHSNVSTPLSPENSGFSWVQTSGTQATTTSTTYTSSTLGGTTNPPSPSYTIPSIVADFRLEKARSLVASITRRLEETPGAGKTGSESDRARVRGKRVLRKACQYAVSDIHPSLIILQCVAGKQRLGTQLALLEVIGQLIIHLGFFVPLFHSFHRGVRSLLIFSRLIHHHPPS